MSITKELQKHFIDDITKTIIFYLNNPKMNGFEFMSVLDMKNIYTCMEVKYFNTYNDTIMKKKCLNAHIEKKI